MSFLTALRLSRLPSLDSPLQSQDLWIRLASLVVSRPRAILIGLLILGLPVSSQVLRLRYSLSLIDALPKSSALFTHMELLGQDFPLGLSSVQKLIVVPRTVSQHGKTQSSRDKLLSSEECVNDDSAVRRLLEQLMTSSHLDQRSFGSRWPKKHPNPKESFVETQSGPISAMSNYTATGKFLWVAFLGVLLF